MKLVRGVQLSIEEDRFKTAVFSATSWFKVRGQWVFCPCCACVHGEGWACAHSGVLKGSIFNVLGCVSPSAEGGAQGRAVEHSDGQI